MKSTTQKAGIDWDGHVRNMQQIAEVSRVVKLRVWLLRFSPDAAVMRHPHQFCFETANGLRQFGLVAAAHAAGLRMASSSSSTIMASALLL